MNSLPVGKTFVYQYNGLNKIENEDITQEVSFSSEVLVSVPAPCKLSVRMRSVVSPHKQFVDILEKNPIEVSAPGDRLRFVNLQTITSSYGEVIRGRFKWGIFPMLAAANCVIFP